MKVVVIPSGFKESLSSEEVGAAIEKGIRQVNPQHKVTVIPMVDGGEGFVETIVKLKQRRVIGTEVVGPVGTRLDCFFGLFTENGVKTAVIEMVSISGLCHVPRDERNQLKTTTYGVGETIIKAVDHGAERTLSGCRDSGTSDGGVGMAQAIGVTFKDDEDREIFVEGGGEIDKIHSVDMSGIDPRIHATDIDVAVNWKNVLCGENGVAHVFGPQKGASPEDVKKLSGNLDHLSELIFRMTGEDLSKADGGGASGGLGAGLVGFTGAVLHPRFDIIRKYVEISDAIQNADLVITAEGCIDFQTPNGKIPSEVARIAKSHDKPVIAFAGTIGRKAEVNYESGIDAFTSIIPKPATLEKSMTDASKWLQRCTESAFRHLAIGITLAEAVTEHGGKAMKVRA